MIPMRTVSAAALLAAILIYPVGSALAATDAAKPVMAMPADALPAGSIAGLIGTWKPVDLGLLDGASAVKVFDTKTLYKGSDLQMIASANTARASDISKFRDAIRADAGLKKWFDTNKIDINRVVGFENDTGTPDVFLY